MNVPNALSNIKEANIFTENPKTEPDNTSNTNLQWFDANLQSDEKRIAEAKDMAFVVRNDETGLGGWTDFNRNLKSEETHNLTSVGYMPIIQAPAHEMDTLNTVVERCLYTANALLMRLFSASC